MKIYIPVRQTLVCISGNSGIYCESNWENILGNQLKQYKFSGFSDSLCLQKHIHDLSQILLSGRAAQLSRFSRVWFCKRTSRI